jgi:hypothetical protein
MKTKNKSIITAMAIVAIVTIGFFACEEEKPKCTCPEGTSHFADEPCCEGDNCKCTIKPRCNCGEGAEHLFVEPNGETDGKPSCCDGEDCNCGVYYGVLPNGVKIYKGAGVTDAQAVAAVLNIVAGYEVADSLGKSGNGKFTKVIVVSNGGYTWDGSVLGIDYGKDSGYCELMFECIEDGVLPLVSAQLQTTNNIKLADNALTKSNRVYC